MLIALCKLKKVMPFENVLKSVNSCSNIVRNQGVIRRNEMAETIEKKSVFAGGLSSFTYF